MIGSIVNFFAVIAGSLVGIFFRDILPERVQRTLMNALSLSILLIGINMALGTKNILIVIFSLVLGGIIGELLKLEERLDNLGEGIKKKFKTDNDLFVQGFVQASLVFCVGAMAIMGSIQDGINNDPTILFNKSLLDGIASIAFAATFGIGVLFSSLIVLIYQGSITIVAAYVQQFLTEAMITEMTAVGGLLIVAIGFNMLKLTKIKCGNMIPSLFIALILTPIF